MARPLWRGAEPRPYRQSVIRARKHLLGTTSARRFVGRLLLAVTSARNGPNLQDVNLIVGDHPLDIEGDAEACLQAHEFLDELMNRRVHKAGDWPRFILRRVLDYVAALSRDY